jgi:hypothetical protein
MNTPPDVHGIPAPPLPNAPATEVDLQHAILQQLQAANVNNLGEDFFWNPSLVIY